MHNGVGYVECQEDLKLKYTREKYRSCESPPYTLNPSKLQCLLK